MSKSQGITVGAVVVDNNVLVKWTTEQDESETKKRLDHLLLGLEKRKQRLIVPAPVVAEFLVEAFDARNDFLTKLRQSSAVAVASFDYRAALECAILTSNARNLGDKKYGGDSPLQKIKVDEQIVAISRVNQAALIVSDDSDIKKIAGRFGIDVKTIEELDLPPSATQMSLIT